MNHSKASKNQEDHVVARPEDGSKALGGEQNDAENISSSTMTSQPTTSSSTTQTPKAQEDMNRHIRSDLEQKTRSDSVECSKCKNKQIAFSQASMAEHEPVKTFCECQVCGWRWVVV